MSWMPSNNSKYCVNCANWSGPRKEKLGCAESPSPSEKGKCAYNVSSAQGRCESERCDKF